VSSNVTGATTRVTRTDDGAAVTRRGAQGGFVGASGGDVYAGRDGNVYRKQGDSWQRYDSGSWNGVQESQRTQAGDQNRGTAARTDAGTMGQLNRDSASRSAGGQRSSDAAHVRSAPSGARTGSYRPSGGMRGGGGRRR
jgi:hypothetical protein